MSSWSAAKAASWHTDTICTTQKATVQFIRSMDRSAAQTDNSYANYIMYRQSANGDRNVMHPTSISHSDTRATVSRRHRLDFKTSTYKGATSAPTRLVSVAIKAPVHKQPQLVYADNRRVASLLEKKPEKLPALGCTHTCSVPVVVRHTAILWHLTILLTC